jgi:hypothetical protein
MNGIQQISQERKDQLEKCGIKLHHDVDYNAEGQLAKAASILCIDYPMQCLTKEDVEEDYRPEGWNEQRWINMINKPYVERLAIAGALLAAEIDRINYNNETGNF